MSKQIIICQQGINNSLMFKQIWKTVSLYNIVCDMYPSFQHQNKNVNTYSFVADFRDRKLLILSIRVGYSFMYMWSMDVMDD